MGKQKLNPIKKRKFNRLRRKAKLNFDAFYRQFANDLTFSEIAQRAGISRPRVGCIYADYFSGLLGMTALNRRKAREGRIRERQLGRIRQAIEKDRVLRALKGSATNAASKRRIEPILTIRRGSDPTRRFRRKAVLVDGHREPVHHLRAEPTWQRKGELYTCTAVTREELETSSWVIFFLDVPGHRRRVIRCNSKRLLGALFSDGVQRRGVYLPLDCKPSRPLYDFLADEDNW